MANDRLQVSTTEPNAESWLQDHARPVAGAGMAQSFLLNVVVLAVGVSIWWLRRPAPDDSDANERLDGSPNRNIHEFGPRRHSTALNYLVFLKIAAEMCTTLAFVNSLIVIPYWGVHPLLMGIFGGRISLATEIDATGIVLIGLITAVSGLIALTFTQRMKRRMRVRTAVHPWYLSYLDRTVWMSNIPVADSLTGEPFELSDREFKRVEDFLAKAIEDEIVKKGLGHPGNDARGGAEGFAVERVHVPRVVDDWYALDAQLVLARQRLDDWIRSMEQDQLHVLESRHRNSHWLLQRTHRKEKEKEQDQLGHRNLPKFLAPVRLSLLEGRVKKVDDLQTRLQETAGGPKRMSGHAFVTFKAEALQYKDELFSELRSLSHSSRNFGCWKYESAPIFRFGVPPFSSVSLKCMRAPPPTDVVWENLQIKYASRLLRFWLGTFFLLFFMVVLVTPVSISSELSSIIPELRQRSKALARHIHDSFGITLPEKPFVWQWMYVQLPTTLILLINSSVVPVIISGICYITGSHTWSQASINEMHLNYSFLVLNQLAIPVLGLTGLPMLLEFLEVRLMDEKSNISVLKLLDGSLLSSPGHFALRYLLNCAFLTNANSLLNISQRTVRWIRDQKISWIFPWGYWYASTLSTLTTTLSLGCLVPSLLPCGALFFALKYRIDFYNLENREYLCGPESHGSFISRVLFVMRIIVAGMWFSIGTSIYFTVRRFFANDWDAAVQLQFVELGAVLLIVASLCLCFYSWREKAACLSASTLRLPSFSQRNKEVTSARVDHWLDVVFRPFLPDVEHEADVTVQSNKPDVKSSLNARLLSEDCQPELPRSQLVWDCRRWLSDWEGIKISLGINDDSEHWTELPLNWRRISDDFSTPTP